MKKVVKILPLLAAFVFAACSGLTDGGPNFAAWQQTGTNSQGAAPAASHKTVIFSGSLSSGALPKSIANSVNFSAAKEADSGQALISRSASPDIEDSEYYYYVKTTCKETGVEKTYDQGDPIFVSGASSVAFELPLLTGYTWTIECGFKKTGLADPILFDKTQPIALDETTSVITASFVARPNPSANGGKGSVLLNLSGSYKTATISCSDDGWKAAAGGQTTDLVVSYNEAANTGSSTLNLASIKAGAYEVTFSFYNKDGIMIFQTVQMISVLAGMQTNSWVRSDGDDGVVINSDNFFMVGEPAMQAFDRKTFYVGKVVEGTTVSDANAGTAYAPFETLGAAEKAIAARGSSAVDYNIYISGTVQNDCDLQAIASTKAKSVTISGINGGTLKAKTSGQPVLNIMSTAPLHLRDITIDGEGAASEGVSVNPASAGLYIEGGTVITGCKRGVSVGSGKTVYLNGGTITQNVGTVDGAGVYVSSGATLCMRGGTISQNESSADGGGVCSKGNFLLYGGSVNNNTAKNGGGVYLPASGASLTMSGGKIFQNQATAFGGGVFAGRNSNMAATGGEILQNTAPAESDSGTAAGNQPGGGAICVEATSCSIGDYVYIPYGDKSGGKGAGKNDIGLRESGSHKSPVTVASPLSRHASSSPIALTPNWKRGFPIVESSDKSLTAASQEKVTLTADMDEGWEYVYSEDEKTIKIDAPFYVGSYNGTLGSDSNDGAKTSPFRTLAKACQQMNDGGADYTIKIIGSTYGSGAQEIPDTLISAKAKSVTIIGYGDNATINRGLTSSTADGYALKISTSVPVTLTKVTVTGGHNSGNGGGIIVDPGAVLCLGKGSKVVKNVSDERGGGIYALGTVFVCSDAKIGDRDVASLTDDNYIAGSSSYSNCAKIGGGIFADANMSNAAQIYLGYRRNDSGAAEKDDECSGGIYYNYASDSAAGGVATQSASEDKKAKLTMCGGTIAYNSASADGGGVYNKGALELNGGTIKENKAANPGGAVFFSGTDASAEFNGAVLIPYGDGTKRNPYNDVCVGVLPGGVSNQLTLGSSFSLADSTKKIKLTPQTISGYSFKKRKILTGTISDTKLGYFDLNAPGFKLDTTVASGYATLMLKNIVTSIYVASTADSGDNRTGPKGSDPSGYTIDDATWNSATYEYNGSTNNSAKPFATIAKAAQFITYQESPSNYTIYVDGTLVGAQSLANSNDSSFPVTLGNTTATKITLASKNGLDSSKNPKDILNGNNSRTLNISASVPIHILALGITGGSTSGNGGGICIATSGTSLSVTLGDGTDANGPKIYGNHAYCGGGVYCGTNTSLAIKNGARITENYADKGSGNYKYGGGIYTEGTRLDMTGGEISCNQVSAWGTGGGVWSGAVFVMTGGTIKGNRAANGGGLLNTGQFYMSGTAIIGTELQNNAWATADTQYANIAEKRTINSTTNGGDGGGIRNSGSNAAVYIGYSLGNGGVVSKAAFSDDGNKYGVVTNYAHAFGGGIINTSGEIHVAAGDVSNNNAAQGGGGICSTYSQILDLDGSSYKVRLERNQSANDGGAIKFSSSNTSVNLTMKGNVDIPGGAGAAGNNDIYINNANDTHIAVAGALTGYYCVTVEVVTPDNPYAKYKVLDVTSGSGQVTQKVFKRFDITNANAYLDSQGYVQVGYEVDSFTVGGSKTLPADIPNGATLVVDENKASGLNTVATAIKNAKPKTFKVDLTRMNNSSIIELDSDTPCTFQGCTNITEVAFDGEKLRPSVDAFNGCSNLQTVKVINEARTYGNNGSGSWSSKAFENCGGLTTFDFTECSDVQLSPGTMFLNTNNTVTTVKLGTMLETLRMSQMHYFGKSGFMLTYDGSANDLKTKVTTTQGPASTPKTVTCQCASGGNLTWNESTSGPWQ